VSGRLRDDKANLFEVSENTRAALRSIGMAPHTTTKATGRAQEFEALWTVHEASAFLRLSRKTVYRKAAEGTMPSTKIGGSLRFVPSDVRGWATGDMAAVSPSKARG
jgi:excisionase family DNA binding protein